MDEIGDLIGLGPSNSPKLAGDRSRRAVALLLN
jgi:hypothetical protein